MSVGLSFIVAVEVRCGRERYDLPGSGEAGLGLALVVRRAPARPVLISFGGMC